MTTLNREQAHDVIAECGRDITALLDLQQHWIGHRDVALSALEPFDEVIILLTEYVDARADDAAPDNTRSNGPKDSDDTGLVAP